MRLHCDDLGVNVNFLCPPEWAGDFEAQHSWDGLLEESDVIMLLRVQHERHDVTFFKRKLSSTIWVDNRTGKANERTCNHHASSTSQPGCGNCIQN